MASVEPRVRWLDEGARSYYKRVEVFLDGEQDGGDELFLKNVFLQVVSDGACRVCCDKDGSRAVERLLGAAVVDESSLAGLLEALSPDYYTATKDRCGSHVVEALLKKIGNVLATNASESLNEQFQALYVNLKEHVAELIGHPYASHVLSMLFQVLSGLYFGDHVSRSKYSQEFRKAKMGANEKSVVASSRKPVPASFNKLLDALAKQICKLDNFNTLVSHECASPVLQVLLRVLSQRLPKRNNRLIKKIVKSSQVFKAETSPSPSSSSSSPLPSVFTDVVGSHLLESVIEVAPADLHAHIYQSCFQGNVLRFAVHPVANYPLQHLILSATPTLVSALAEELVALEEVLFAGHSGVVVRLAQALLACPEQQASCLAALLQAFHVDSQPALCAPLFLTLTAYEVYFSSSEKAEGDGEEAHPSKMINMHGSLLVQALLRFEKPKVVARSLLKMPLDEILSLSCDQNGSHVIDAFMSSPTVSTKLKSKLTEKLKLRLCELCTDKHGSRAMDAVWRQSQVASKERLAQELLAHEAELSEDFFGKIVLRNCNISHYKSKQAAWKTSQQAAERKRDLFKDILSTEESQQTTPIKKRRAKLQLLDSDGEDPQPLKKSRKL